jgi:hypothetical protein
LDLQSIFGRLRLLWYSVPVILENSEWVTTKEERRASPSFRAGEPLLERLMDPGAVADHIVLSLSRIEEAIESGKLGGEGAGIEDLVCGGMHSLMIDEQGHVSPGTHSSKEGTVY